MLDFYLLGIARSGTTAFRQALNLHPSVYCSVERFPLDLSPKEIRFPETFLDESNSRHLAETLKELSPPRDLTDIEVVGDKQPLKFRSPLDLRLTGSNVFIYRSYTNTTQSWDVRAANPNDKGWPASKTGSFFFWDLLHYFNVLPIDKPPLAIVNFDEVFFGDFESEFIHVFETIKVSHELYPSEVYRDRLYRKKEYHRICNNPKYNNLAEKFQLRDFEESFFRSRIEQRRELLSSYSHFIKANTQSLTEMFASELDPSEKERLEVELRRSNLNLTGDSK